MFNMNIHYRYKLQLQVSIHFIWSWTQHTSTKMNLSFLETQDLFLEAPGIFCRIEVNLGPNSFKYETGEMPSEKNTKKAFWKRRTYWSMQFTL